MKRYSNRARPLALLVAVAVSSTVAAPPSLAADPSPARPLAAAAAAAGAALPAAAVTQAAQATPAAPVATAPALSAEKPFLKSTKGVVALILTAGALGYMTYSFSNDRVKSPQR